MVWGVVEIGRPLKFYAAWGMGGRTEARRRFHWGGRKGVPGGHGVAKIMFCSAFQASVRLCEPPLVLALPVKVQMVIAKLAFLSSSMPARVFSYLEITFFSSNMPAGAFPYLKNSISEQ